MDVVLPSQLPSVTGLLERCGARSRQLGWVRLRTGSTSSLWHSTSVLHSRRSGSCSRYVFTPKSSSKDFLLTKFQETKQLTLEEIDLLFGDRALGTLPDNLDDKQREIELERIDAAKKKLAGTSVAAVH